MNFIQYPEVTKASDLQIWKNPAFDNGDSEDSAAIRPWSPIKPIVVNRSESVDSIPRKENQSPDFVNSPILAKSPRSVKPLHPNGAFPNSQTKQTRPGSKQGLFEKSVLKNSNEEEARDENKIDAEIEEIQKEIGRLSSRLEFLRLEKAKKNAKMVEKRGRVVPAKFMEHKQSVKNGDGAKKGEEISSFSARTKVRTRGLSLGPAEIYSGGRRGVSLGPSEIAAGVKSRGMVTGKQEVTPQATQSRRKSFFWKLQDIDEDKVTKERPKSSSISPKSQRNISKTPFSRQAATTVGSKKVVKKEDGLVNSIQPKKLFREGEKSALAKKPIKPGRVVASRYNQSLVQSTANSAIRKRSLPENENDEMKRGEKKRSLSVGKSRPTMPETTQNYGTEIRVKKRWEIPNELAVCKKLEMDDESPSPPATAIVRDMLPRIRTLKCTKESPRDSGPAKKVSELIGRKTYFSNEGALPEPICQTLSFVEEEEDF